MTRAKTRSERKFAEQGSDEDTTSQIIEEKTARLEPSTESELETSKESDTARVADVKIVVDSPTTFKTRQVTECDINESARSLNTP